MASNATPSLASTIVDGDGRPAILEFINSQKVDRFGWTDFAWHATARMRYCNAYCRGRIYDALKDRTHTDHGLIPGDQLHTPGCAYATDIWIRRAIEMLREVNRG